MASPPQPYVPYQAYKSKRHSRNISASHLTPNQSPPPISRPPTAIGSPLTSEPVVNGTGPIHEKLDLGPPHPAIVPPDHAETSSARSSVDEKISASSPAIIEVTPPEVQSEDEDENTPTLMSPETHPPHESPLLSPERPASRSSDAPTSSPSSAPPYEPPASPSPGPSTSTSPSRPSPLSSPSKPNAVPRKSSTLRHIPLRAPSNASTSNRPFVQSRTPSVSSPLRPGSHSRVSSTSSTPVVLVNGGSSARLPVIRNAEKPLPVIVSQRHSSLAPGGVGERPVPNDRAQSYAVRLPHLGKPTSHLPRANSIQPTHGISVSFEQTSGAVSPSQLASPSAVAPPLSADVSPPPSPILVQSPPTSARSPPPGRSGTASPSIGGGARGQTLYRPGFQPKGVYRPQTELFFSLRSACRTEGRVERTKLERRLEKLIELHFPRARMGTTESGLRNGDVHDGRPGSARRSSSFWESFGDLREGKVDAGGLWKSVVASEKGDIREAEQRITPWVDDSSAAKCPICSAPFQPITNRKHHCRLCGDLVCALPVKRPIRPVPCSILFVVDPNTRRIEEVSEGVDYGVRKRKPSMDAGKAKQAAEDITDEEKFLKGVRICHKCRPVLQRQQYQQESRFAPPFVQLYQSFIAVEKEIEDALPQFQELLQTLSNDDQPTKEASAARKRLLNGFARYDAIAKRIRSLPTANGSGSSQDRVQAAVASRAALFLQEHMFPLQSLPKPKPRHAKSDSDATDIAVMGDEDAKLAHALQPLLEQEALLESFVTEAKAHRKFEDAKTLKANLEEIRAEINNMVRTGGANGKV